MPNRRRLALFNVIHSLGCDSEAARQIVRRMYSHLVLSIFELFRHGGPKGRKFSYSVVGKEHYQRVVNEGRGAILLTAHMGNWELLVRYGATLGPPLSVIRKDLKLSVFQKLWLRLRNGGEQEVGTIQSARRAAVHLKNGGLLGVVLDQHAAESKAIVRPFFGRGASTSTGAVRLARHLNVPILPAVCVRTADEHHEIRFGQPIWIAKSDQRMSDIVGGVDACLRWTESAISATPSQWLWIHRRWKSVQAGR